MSKSRHIDQRGMVSFMITLIMMLVISLIVIGFTQVVNDNRRQALDRQLSAQAFYAAESGVNATATIISGLLPGDVPSQDKCTGGGLTYDPKPLNADGTVSYTCVLVNPLTPDILTTASQSASVVVPINPVSSNGTNQTVKELTFTWSAPQGVTPDATTCSTPANTFVTSAAYACDFAQLRIDLMQYDPAAASADDFANNTIALFLQPKQAEIRQTVATFSGATKAYAVAAACTSSSGVCTSTIELTGAARAQHYYARLTTLYRSAHTVSIDGSVVNPKDVYFKNAQAIVDVTGKAQDVLRRVQVRIPLQDFGASNLPSGAIQSPADVCKRFTAHAGNYNPECAE